MISRSQISFKYLSGHFHICHISTLSFQLRSPSGATNVPLKGNVYNEDKNKILQLKDTMIQWMN